MNEFEIPKINHNDLTKDSNNISIHYNEDIINIEDSAYHTEQISIIDKTNYKIYKLEKSVELEKKNLKKFQDELENLQEKRERLFLFYQRLEFMKKK